MKALVQVNDLYNLQFVNGVKLRADGKVAIFKRQRPSKSENRYETDFFLYDLRDRSTKLFLTASKAKIQDWTESGELLMIEERKEKQAVFTLNPETGAKSDLFELEGKVDEIIALADGRYLLKRTVKTSRIPDLGLGLTEGEDFEYFDELPFQSNGKGYINKMRTKLFILDKDGKEGSSLNSEFASVGDLCLSPSGKLLAFTEKDYSIKDGQFDALRLCTLENGECLTLISGTEEHTHGDLCFIDEETLFYTDLARTFPGENPRPFHFRLPSAERKALPFDDCEFSGSIGTDVAYGGDAKLYVKDGSLYFVRAYGHTTSLCRLTPEGQYERLQEGEIGYISWDMVGDVVLYAAQVDEVLPELYKLNPTDGSSERLSFFNREFELAHDVALPEYFTWTNECGYEMDGFVLRPRNFETGKTYPAVFEMHGGPKSIYGGLFHHEMQCLAAKGYFVFYTNPRGSDGRGEEFANITGEMGFKDFRDFMGLLPEVFKRYPEIDQNRVGICGGSYGGFMCNWMIGHSKAFRAAVSQRSIASYLTKPFTTDIGYYHNLKQITASPWEDFDEVWRHSPLSGGLESQTPTLFLHSDEDHRCWMMEAMQMHAALCAVNCPSEIMLFHGENHNLSRTGKPQNRIHRLQALCDWFDRWL